MIKCKPGKIINPKSGRCVNKDGRIGKLIVATTKTSVKCENNKIINPKSGRCVNKDGRIGKLLLSKKKSSNIIPFGPGIPLVFESLAENCEQNKIWKKKTLIGTGTVGKAYVACNAKNCDYVLKIQKANHEFFTEILAIQELKKYNITPKLFAAWTCKGKGYAVIEKLKPYEECQMTSKQLWIQLDKYMKKLRDAGWLHMDLHIGNIMCSNNNKLVIIDFGHAVKRTSLGDLQTYPNHVMSRINWYNFPLTWEVLEAIQNYSFQSNFNPNKTNSSSYYSALKKYKKVHKKLCEQGCLYAC